MKQEVKTFETYEKPTIEIVEFVLEDSIAQSGTEGIGLWEEVQ